MKKSKFTKEQITYASAKSRAAPHSPTSAANWASVSNQREVRASQVASLCRPATRRAGMAHGIVMLHETHSHQRACILGRSSRAHVSASAMPEVWEADLGRLRPARRRRAA